jgi:hypothetical protein
VDTQAFSLQINSFLGSAKGATIPIADPSSRQPRWGLLRPELADAVIVGEGHAPVVAVLVPAGKNAEPDESIPDPKGRESRTPKHFPCK